MLVRVVLPLSLLALASCASIEPNGVWGFGHNKFSPLTGKDTVIRTPKTISSFADKCVRQSVVTHRNGIFVTCDGKVYMTGANIGPSGKYSQSESDVASEPVLIETLVGHHVVMVAAGTAHFVVVTQQGLVMTWGHNHDGQLGYGNEVPFSAIPLEVVSLTYKNIRYVAAGGNRSAAISDTGKLYMWGMGASGEMGDGTTRSHRKPVLVQSFESNKERVCQVAMGNDHVVAVTNAGDLYTWGDGTEGQLGLGDFGIQRKKPMPVSRLRRNVCHVAAGADFTAVVTQDERVFLWGSNGYPNPFEKTFFQGKHARQIGSGGAHMVVLLSNGTVASWGAKRYGQVGREFSGDFTLEAGVIPMQELIRQVSVGEAQTVLLGGNTPAPSLCACLDGWFTFWRTEMQFVSRCTDEQTQCGDGSCCGTGETCCAISDASISPLVTFRAVDEKLGKSAVPVQYKCMAVQNGECCAPGSSLACPKDFKCNLESQPKRCEPKNLHVGTTEEELIELSQEPFRSNSLSQYPGALPGVGVCGSRKETCPDETCCNMGQSCCPLPDGSYGCCNHVGAACCKSGCCADGFECDDLKFACVKRASDNSVTKQSQDPVTSQCGAGRRACPDRSCCPSGSQCCVLNDGFFGCCPYSNGVCCVDGAGCCPASSTCDVAKQECVRHDLDGAEVRTSMKSTPRNTPQRSAVGEVTCPNGMSCQYPGSCCPVGDNQYTCCDFVNGTCCDGGLGCCPSNFQCEPSTSTCRPLGAGTAIPMKFSRDPKPAVHPPTQTAESAPPCKDATSCSDGSCCPMGSTCCPGPNGKTTCCDYLEATCCSDGGCCSSEHVCDVDAKLCKDKSGTKSYAYLSSQNPTPPSRGKADSVSNPGKCYPDETKCADDFCCPRSATCCNKGFGQNGCCPHTHGVCCEGGGCCPGGSTCDVNSKTCTFPNDASKSPAPMLAMDMAHAPEAEWDLEECWDDEQTCAIDGGCCLKTETCCTVASTDGIISACCPHENGVCCAFGGCCPADSTCDESSGMCIDPHGNHMTSASVKGSAQHPLASAADVDCPDGTVCEGSQTCCSLGFDPEWGEETYGCCEHENGVCCADHERCCPNGYECDLETGNCITDGRQMEGSGNTPTDPPPTFVCLFPQTQCPNGKCCEESEQCVEQASGNYKCLPRGYAACNNGSHGCPVGLYCDSRNGAVICSAEEDNDPQVKKDLLRKYWGDDVHATCSSILLQESQSDDSFSPQVKVERPPTQYWYPKKLVMKSKGVKATSTLLPTVLAAKICQHLTIVNSTAMTELCFLSNANGHFLMKDRERVKQLVDEYSRRVCEHQRCAAPVGPVYVFQAEELDPCPCREKPTPVPVPVLEAVPSGDVVIVVDAIARAEEQAAKVDAPQFIEPVHVIADEKPVASLSTGASGSVPVTAEKPVDDVIYSLVPPSRDAMQLTQTFEVGGHDGPGDLAMAAAHRVETFMGPEACNEDEAEAAVDLDGQEALQLDSRANDREAVSTSATQMDVVNSDHTLMAE